MMYNVQWTTRRDVLTQVLRLHGRDRVLSSSGKRLRAGPPVAGSRSCQYPYNTIFGDIGGSLAGRVPQWAPRKLYEFLAVAILVQALRVPGGSQR
eukprot:1407578-Pyramimonas_sp.AAC.1